MSNLTKEEINMVGGQVIKGKDVTFIIKTVRTAEWGIFMTYSHRGTRWFEYDALFVITNSQTMKLTWVGRGVKSMHDDVVRKVRSKKIKSIIDLYDELGKHADRHGAPIRLTHTKLEYFL